MKKVYYKVLFYDRINNEYYLLGYTWDKKANKKYHIEQGFKSKDLIYEKRVQK